MTEVDLIPDEFKISHHRYRRMRYWMVLIVVVVCTAGLFSGAKYFTWVKEDRAAREIAAQYNQLQKDIERLDREKNQLNTWKSQLAWIGQLGQYVDFVKVTSFLAKHTPKLVYLEVMDFVCPNPAPGATPPASALPKSSQKFILKDTATSQTTPAPNPSMNMFVRGRAFHYQAVAEYLATLRSASLFQNVELKRSWRYQKTSSTTQGNIQFEIQCEVMATYIGQGEQYATLPKTENF